MGFPMAGHLAAAGHAVTVYNRTATKAADWVKKHGGAAAPTPRAAAAGAEMVFTCVGNDEDLRSVVLGERSEEHTSELQSLMRISYAVFCLKKKKTTKINKAHDNYTE